MSPVSGSTFLSVFELESFLGVLVSRELSLWSEDGLLAIKESASAELIFLGSSFAGSLVSCCIRFSTSSSVAWYGKGFGVAIPGRREGAAGVSPGLTRGDSSIKDSIGLMPDMTSLLF